MRELAVGTLVSCPRPEGQGPGGRRALGPGLGGGQPGARELAFKAPRAGVQRQPRGRGRVGWGGVGSEPPNDTLHFPAAELLPPYPTPFNPLPPLTPPTNTPPRAGSVVALAALPPVCFMAYQALALYATRQSFGFLSSQPYALYQIGNQILRLQARHRLLSR